MEVKDFQKKIISFVSAWDKKREVEPDEQLTFNHLVEKVGELAREYVNQQKRKDKFSSNELNNAIADILIQTIRLAHLRGLDIEETVLKVIKEEQKLLDRD